MTGGLTASEARRNLSRHPGEAVAAVTAITAATAAAGVLAQYWRLVDRALEVAGRSPTTAEQASGRPALMCAGSAAVLLLTGATVWLATARRRRTARLLLERLGAGPELTRRPALAEGLVVGIVGGVLGTALALALSPAVANFERATIPSQYTVHTLKPNGGGVGLHGRAGSTTYRISVDEITDGATALAVIALGTMVLGTGLGVLTAAVTLLRPAEPDDR